MLRPFARFTEIADSMRLGAMSSVDRGREGKKYPSVAEPLFTAEFGGWVPESEAGLECV